MDQNKFYRVEKQPPLAWVYLNRPDKKNAMNRGAWKESAAIFEDLDNDPEIRSVILAGKGTCFSTGIDLVDMMPQLPELLEKTQKGEVKWRFLAKLHELQRSINCIEHCRKPVIAAIHGHCIGAGLDMVTACDIRLCSEDALFSLREASVGFVADVGVLQRIPAIVGQGIARELAFTAKFFNAQKAKSISLVNEVYKTAHDLMEGATQMATEIAENAPLAVQASKDVLNFCVGKSVEDGLKYVAAVSSNIIPSDDLTEAVTAFAEKRKPKF